MSYYRKFRIVIGTPLWRLYLRWAYKKCVCDVKKLDFYPDFIKKDFTCLLCGVGNETTADEFIKFVTERNPSPKIIIIDIGDEQIAAVKKLIAKKYLNLNIKVKKINALRLKTFIKKNTIDWIETDGFFEYFDDKSLKKLLLIWKELLTKDGFITTRACSSHGLIDQIIDKSRIWLGKVWIGVTLYPHDRKKLRNLLKETGFKYFKGLTGLPTFKRYSISLFLIALILFANGYSLW